MGGIGERLGGGQTNLRRLQLSAGDASLDAHGANLTVDGDGRLEGALSANLAPQVLARLAAAGAPIERHQAAQSASVALGARTAGAPIMLEFQAGRTTLGPVSLLPAPKVY